MTERPSSPSKPTGTSREQIIETALRIVESSGVEALTMRKLSAELGVAPTAIYWHIGGREDLLNALVDSLIAEVVGIVPKGATTAERITSIARAIRDEVRVHPHLVQLTNQLGRGPAMSFPSQVALAREVTAAGLSGAAGAEVVRSILWFVGGFILLEGFTSRSLTTTDLWRGAEAPGVDPAIAQAMAEEPETDELFEHGLGALVRSLLRGEP